MKIIDSFNMNGIHIHSVEMGELFGVTVSTVGKDDERWFEDDGDAAHMFSNVVRAFIDGEAENAFAELWA